MPAAIGYVAAHWSMVEQQLAFIIYEMLHLHTILGWATTAELTTLRRINTISAFVNLTGEKAWIDAWADIAVTLDDLRNRQNYAVHSRRVSWLQDTFACASRPRVGFR